MGPLRSRPMQRRGTGQPSRLLRREDIGAHMKDFATTHNLLSTPRPALIGSYFGKDMLFATPLLRWYIQHGLVVSNVSLIVEYEPSACFQKFAERVTKERRRGDMDKAYAIIAEMFKLLGNCAYGKTISNIAKHADVTFVSDKELGKKVAHPLWKKTTPLYSSGRVGSESVLISESPPR